jgi:hypothetical protein
MTARHDGDGCEAVALDPNGDGVMAMMTAASCAVILNPISCRLPELLLFRNG